MDAGKQRPGLVLGSFPRALKKVVEIGTYGANKYTDNGWLHVPNGEPRYTDAMHRHLLEEACGIAKDPESNMDHLAHAAWNLLVVIELRARAEEKTK